MKRIASAFASVLFLCAISGLSPCVCSWADTSQFANNVILAQPKVDGEGYVSAASKIFYIAMPNAQPGDPFEIQTRSGTVAFQGTLGAKAIDDTASSGEMVLRGDFSALTDLGTYQVVVDGHKSAPFQISADPYFDLYHDAARTISLIRCGVAIDDPVTGLKHAACHMDDASVRGEGTKADFTGGWHNAGDYGKWVPTSCIATSMLMWTYTLGSQSVRDEPLDIGEAQDGLPDLLAEAKWGLTWLFKMQRPDGSVFHKVDSEPSFAWGTKPENDPTSRSAADAGTLDAADFTAVMAQASQVFKPFDPDFAQHCLSAAEKSYVYIQAHPDVVANDPYYTDHDPSQEILWAQAEMACVTHDKAAITTLRQKMVSQVPNAIFWNTPDALGYEALANDKTVPADLKLYAMIGLQKCASKYETLASQTGYAVALDPREYQWESNQYLLGRACVMLFAWSADHQLGHRIGAINQLHYLLGCNSLNTSYVTRHGSNPITHPYNWSYFDYNILIPGWVTGGPNNHPDGADQPLKDLIAKKTPPAKCYLDMCVNGGSWASNEGTLDQEAMLVFVTAMFSGTNDDEARPS